MFPNDLFRMTPLGMKVENTDYESYLHAEHIKMHMDLEDKALYNSENFSE